VKKSEKISKAQKKKKNFLISPGVSKAALLLICSQLKGKMNSFTNEAVNDLAAPQFALKDGLAMVSQRVLEPPDSRSPQSWIQDTDFLCDCNCFLMC
jgi:hypothetical protein